MHNAIKPEQQLILKMNIQRTPFVKSLNHAMKAVSNRTTIPILTGIKLTATTDAVVLTGSDANVSIESRIPLEEDGENGVVEQPGSIVLQGTFFADLVKKLPEDTLEISVDERFTATIHSGSTRFHLNGLDPEEYPELPNIDGGRSFRLRTDLLRDVIRQTVFAASASESQPVLTGTNWEIRDRMLTCVATDGHRLASRSASVEETKAESLNAVIPGESLNELGKILEDGTDWVDVEATESQVLFRTGHLLFYSRLLEDHYPDTDRLIPKESKTDVVVEKRPLLEALERAWLLAREERNHVVKLNIAEGEPLEISSHSAELGKVFEKVPVQSLEGDDMKISFSAKFVMEALRAIDAADVHIRFTGAMRPFVIQPTEDDTVLQLVLPVRSY